MCPNCGKNDTVLQSVTSEHYECRPELGGCGAIFDRPVGVTPADTDCVREALGEMRSAICEFEETGLAIGPDCAAKTRRGVEDLLERLKEQIGRIAAKVED